MRSNRRLLEEFAERHRSNEEILEQVAVDLAEDEAMFSPKAAREVEAKISKCIEVGERILRTRANKPAPEDSEWVAWRTTSHVYLQQAGGPAASQSARFAETIVAVSYEHVELGLDILREVLALARRSLPDNSSPPQPRPGKPAPPATMRDVDLAPEFLHLLAEYSRPRAGMVMVEVPSMADELPGTPGRPQLERVARLLESRGLLRVRGISPMTVVIEPEGYVHDETHYQPQPRPVEQGPQVSTELPAVFVVHGHDHATRDKIVSFLRKQRGFDTIVLEEEANQGRTIIEKFEAHAHRARFAIVLATADDVGCARGELEKWDPLAKERLLDDPTKKRNKALTELEITRPPTRFRARQNVVLEWGYFAGRLGRDNVMLVKIGDVELPSDLSGILETRSDLEMRILKELKAAGVQVEIS